MKKLIANLVFKLIYLPWLTLKYKTLRNSLKRANKVCALVALLMQYVLRYHEDMLGLKGESEHKNNLVTIVVGKLCGLKYRAALEPLAQKHKKEIGKVVAKAKRIDVITKSLVTFYELRALGFKVLEKEDEKTKYLKQARKLSAKARDLEIKDLYEIEKSVRKQIKSTRGEIADRGALKIDVSLQHVGAILTVVSSLFLVTGFLYNRFLLGAFGIDVSQYFSLADYLASSIDKIRFAAFSALIATIALFLRIHYESRRLEIGFQSQGKKEKDYWLYFIIVVVTAGAIKSYYDESILFYTQMQVLILVIGIYVSWPIAYRYFAKPVPTFFSMIFLFSFAGHMYASIGMTIHKFNNSDIEDLRKYKLHLADGFSMDTNSLVVLSANNSYFFLYDVREKKAKIVRKDKVDYVEVVK